MGDLMEVQGWIARLTAVFLRRSRCPASASGALARRPEELRDTAASLVYARFSGASNGVWGLL